MYMSPAEAASIDSPVPAKDWTAATESERLKSLQAAFEGSGLFKIATIALAYARENGFVTIELLSNLNAADRGTFLLELEKLWKNKVDEAVTVWLEPQKDKSSLRSLRGIEVKK